jgi:hypothetical protein
MPERAETEEVIGLIMFAPPLYSTVFRRFPAFGVPGRPATQVCPKILFTAKQAEISFEELARRTGLGEKSIHRMPSSMPPTLRSLAAAAWMGPSIARQDQSCWPSAALCRAAQRVRPGSLPHLWQ